MTSTRRTITSTHGHQPARHEHLLELLLEICAEFFSHTSPATHHEIDTLLRARDINGGPSWLIDMLSLTRYRLQHPLNGEPATPDD